MNSSGRDGSTVWTVKVRWMLAVAGVLVVLALVSIWLAQPGPVKGRDLDGSPVREDTRLLHLAEPGNCPLPAWISMLAAVGVCAFVAATLILALGTVRLITGRQSNGPAARSESAALMALAIALGTWGFLTARVAVNSISVCDGY